MKLIFASIVALTLVTPALAQEHVSGYYRSDGTYVAPTVRSSPNGTTADNYSTRGNVNPYTGVQGTRSPEPTYRPYVAPRQYAPTGGGIVPTAPVPRTYGTPNAF